MLRKIKLLTSIIIIVCMFFPLSQCSQMNIKDGEKVDNVIEYSIIKNAKLYQYKSNLIPIVLFSLPLFLMLLHLFSFREKLRYELLDVLAGLSVCIFMLLLGYVSALSAAGYTAVVGSIAFMLLSLAESIQTIKARGGIFKPDIDDNGQVVD